ncbi:MAG: hypothetical protein KatS3mg083_633 [Candidatus Dojkabacteria bacterium]|nr:MAG: hypothetical protein KatS3mg083_633 [Candidatus Dojkabacteria bacterium]
MKLIFATKERVFIRPRLVNVFLGLQYDNMRECPISIEDTTLHNITRLEINKEIVELKPKFYYRDPDACDIKIKGETDIPCKGPIHVENDKYIAQCCPYIAQYKFNNDNDLDKFLDVLYEIENRLEELKNQIYRYCKPVQEEEKILIEEEITLTVNTDMRAIKF